MNDAVSTVHKISSALYRNVILELPKQRLLILPYCYSQHVRIKLIYSLNTGLECLYHFFKFYLSCYGELININEIWIKFGEEFSGIFKWP